MYTNLMISKKIMQKLNTLLAKERGTIFKDPGGKINVCLVYPNTYHVGMSNLGFQGVYTLLNERRDTVCERAFLPDQEDIREYERTGMEIVAMESGRPLGEFDIVAFSVSFENDYPNILRILAISKLRARTKDRKGAGPLLMMGGACAFFNPEPVADFFDICLVGEAEEVLPEFMDIYKGSRSREDLYETTAGLVGAYLPGFYEVDYYQGGGIAGRAASGNALEKVRRRYVKDISRNALRPTIITPETEFSNMYLTEAMRGCPWNCRFCVAGHVYKPVRRKDAESLKKELDSAASLGARVGLIAPSLTDYPYASEVLCIDGIDFSITSLRASPKSAELVGYLKGYRSVSIAPEAGSERLRRVIDKRITEEDIIETSRLILSEGIETLRLYFMVGLPAESEGDVEGIVDLVRKIRGLSTGGKIVLTVSTFVPKPFTPFQWHPMERIEVVKSRLKLIKNGIGPLRGVSVFHDVPKYAYMQGLFSMGDRRISRVLEAMTHVDDWRKACAESGIDPGYYIFRQKGFDEILPWDFIDNNISKEKLWEEYQRALQIS